MAHFFANFHRYSRIYDSLKTLSHLSRSQPLGTFQNQVYSCYVCAAVAVFMLDRLEFVCTWLGLATIGVIPALINCTLRQESLFHTIQVAKCKAVICDAELVGDDQLVWVHVQWHLHGDEGQVLCVQLLGGLCQVQHSQHSRVLWFH